MGWNCGDLERSRLLRRGNLRMEGGGANWPSYKGVAETRGMLPVRVTHLRRNWTRRGIWGPVEFSSFSKDSPVSPGRISCNAQAIRSTEV